MQYILIDIAKMILDIYKKGLYELLEIYKNEFCNYINKINIDFNKVKVYTKNIK